jgi:Abnormal spindle-like microcephaly-assoc'd, ASPM-SPD-2-Hydin
VIRHGAAFVCLCLSLSVAAARAQTLQSITINGAGSGQLQTGATAALTAIGHFSDGSSAPVFAQWSSSAGNPQSFFSLSVGATTGSVTALSATLDPVTITATSGAISGSTTFTVTPQTTLYAVEGNQLRFIDNTLVPTSPSSGLPFTSVSLSSNPASVNTYPAAPMALTSDEHYLFVGIPAYDTTSGQDFSVVAIDTTTRQVAATISASLLCYPTSLAVASHYLYVVNAGTSVAIGTPVTNGGCTGAASGNVQVYDINQITSSPWQASKTFTPAMLQAGTGGGVSGAVPLLVAASADQADGLVYVASTANYNSNGTGKGALTTIDVATNSVTASQSLNFGTAASGYAISPLGLTVVTAYPTTWANPPSLPSNGAVHTVFVVGAGFNTVDTNPNGSSGTYFWYQSDACDNSSCPRVHPQLIYPAPGPGTYAPLPISNSPDGKTVVAVNDVFYLDSFTSSDGTSTTGFVNSHFFDTVGIETDNICATSSCLPILSVTARADQGFFIVGSDTFPLSYVSVDTLQSVGSGGGGAPRYRGLVVSQHPEVQLNLKQNATDLSGTTFALRGNFQSSATTYSYQCDWGPDQNGADQVWKADTTIQPLGPTGGTLFPNPPTYGAVNQVQSVIPAVAADANGLPGSIIVPVPVGPVTTQIGAASTTVQLGTTDQFNAQVTNATDFTIASWLIAPLNLGAVCHFPGSVSCPLGTIDSMGLYTAPASMPSPSTIQIWAIPNADTTDASALSNKVTLTLTLPPTASLSTQALTFTSQGVGTTSAPQHVTLTNTGQAALVLSSTPLAITGADASEFAIVAGSTCNASLSIAPNGSCSFDITFTPSASGTRSASLSVTDNSGGSVGAIQKITLTGTGVVPTATPNVSSLTFTSQNVGTTSAAQQITVTNTGQANLILSATAVAITGTNAADYAIASGSNCTANLSIAPGSSCGINVTFKPSAAGTRTATLVVTDNSDGTANSTQMVTLTGTGQAAEPAATLSTLSLTFTLQNVGTTSVAQQITLTNTGQANLVLSSTASAITGANAGDFAIATGTTCAGGLSIAPNGTCAIDITFKPSAAGTRSATLVITDNSGGTTGAMQTVTLTGTGQVVNQPAGSLSMTSLTFTAQNVGTTSAAHQVVLTNVGQANLVLASTTPTISGANAGDFAIATGTTCVGNLSIAPNGSCLMNVTFTPSVAGTRSASLLITDNTGGIIGTTQSVMLSGAGQTPEPKATLSVSSLTFNPQGVGTTSAGQQVTLTNTGQANLVLSSTALLITGANASDYVIASGTSCAASLSIAPNATCVVNVQFAPSAAGTRTATLVVTDNSGGVAGATQMVALSGSGIVAIASVSVSSLTFNAQSVGTTSASQTVSITNNGQANLVLSAAALTITGVNAGDYSIGASSTCTNSLAIAPSGFCAIQIAFSPSGLGTRTASLVITDNSGGNSTATQTVTLNGTGVAPVTVSLYPAAPHVEASGVLQFTPVFQPASGSGPVTWSVSGSGCGGHACGTIDANGLYTAPASFSASAADTVTVTLVADQAVTGSTQVTLYLAPILASGQSQTVTAGNAATYNLSLAAGSGDTTETLKIECFKETLPTGVSCQSVAVQPGASGVSFSFTIQTTGVQNAAIAARTVLLSGIALGLPLWTILFLRRSRRLSAVGRGVALIIFLSITACCACLCGCGTNGSFGQPPPKSFGETPAGTYTIQLDGVGPSGIPEKIGTIVLTVQ